MSQDLAKRAISVWCFLLTCFLCVMVIFCCGESPTDSKDEDRWVPSNAGLENLHILFLAVHPINSSIVFAGTWDGLYKSTNGAQTWARVDSGWNYTQVSAIAFDALNAEVMYAGTKGSGIFKSEDGGESWEKKNVGLVDPTIYSIAADPNHPDTLYVGCDGGINRSYDGADTLSKVHWYNRAFLAVDPQNSQFVFGGGKYNNVYKSEDGGETWFESSAGLVHGSGDRRIQWFLIDPMDPSILYVASNSIGVYKSTNRGEPWTEANKGLSGAKDVRALALDFSSTDRLYAATNNGVFRSDDGAGTWQLMSEGLTNLDAKALAVDPLRPHIIYAGTWGGGVFVWKGQ